jgi:hypothetical protein
LVSLISRARSGHTGSAPDGISEAIEATAFLQASPDTRERVLAFVERRPR